MCEPSRYARIFNQDSKGKPMRCYLVRHGKDDDSVRGGWSNTPLTEWGIKQVEALANDLISDSRKNIVQIFSSDLLRAKQTAEILSKKLDVPVVYLPQFRETNNGVLAGMKNTEALQKYPGLFWNTLGWDESYPDGESPHAFYDRVRDAWYAFVDRVRDQNGDILLVTHGGVINVILHIVNGLEYSNKTKPFPVKHAALISIEL